MIVVRPSNDHAIPQGQFAVAPRASALHEKAGKNGS